MNKKGFTLAELLIVVAIIAVLVAIAIPIFTSLLEKSRDAVSAANIRDAYAEASVAFLTEETTGKAAFTAATESTPAQVVVSGVEFKGEQPGWNNTVEELAFYDAAVLTADLGGEPGEYSLTFVLADGEDTLSLSAVAK